MKSREQIFEDLVNENRQRIYRICLAYLYDRSHAGDLYQEILLQIWISLDNYKGASMLSTWVYRVAVNTAITYNALQKKAKLHELPDAVMHVQDTPSDALDKEQKITDMYRAIGMLQEQDRLMISLLLEGISYKEIADITGETVNNAGVKINRAKARLMKIINNKPADDGI